MARWSPIIDSIVTMSAPRPAGDVDLIGEVAFREIAGHRTPPCVSLFLPTHPAGSQTKQDPIRLKNLLGTARTELIQYGLAAADADDLLGPHLALLDDVEFWRHQAQGLALFAAPGIHRRYRVPLDLHEEALVGPGFRLRPLASLLSGDGIFFVLGLSQNEVRLFQATRSTIAELALGSVPRSLSEAIGEERERQLQARSTGRDTVQFHGHGAGGEVDKQILERFLRAVDRELHKVLGDASGPVVLATVGYYVPIYRSLTRLQVVDGCVEGNPEHQRPGVLHARAWPLVEPLLLAGREHALRSLREAPTALVATDLADVVSAAHDGRVDALLVTEGPPVWGRVDRDTGIGTRCEAPAPDAVDLVDRALSDALLSGAAAYSVDAEDLEGDSAVAAVLRF